MKCVACLLAVVLFVVAEATVLPAYRGYLGGPHYYYGPYPGHCADKDGMYYNGPESFVVCTNGNTIVQPCAPGSANGPLNGYKVGEYYNNGDFCNINLNDLGYSVHNGYYGHYPYYNHHGYGYGFPYLW